MKPTETPGSSPKKAVAIRGLLATILLAAGACAFIVYMDREDARYRKAMKAIGESKRSIGAIEKKLQEIQQQK